MSDLTPEVRLRSARRTLISQMELYGVNKDQAVIQVDSLIQAAQAVASEDVAKLAALEARGVDNWEGYGDAMRSLREEDQ